MTARDTHGDDQRRSVMKKFVLFALFACSVFTATACTYTPTNLRPLDGTDRGIEEFKDHP
jgi:hypothetical protein